MRRAPKRREFKVSVLLSTSTFDDNLHEKFVETEIKQLLETLGQFKIISLSTIERRNKPTLVSAQRQFKLAGHGGWLLRVPLEPIVFTRKPIKFAETIGEAIAKYIADGAQVHVDNGDSFAVMRLERGRYLAIGMYDGKVWSTSVMGQLAKPTKPSTRKQTRASNSR